MLHATLDYAHATFVTPRPIFMLTSSPLRYVMLTPSSTSRHFDAAAFARHMLMPVAAAATLVSTLHFADSCYRHIRCRQRVDAAACYAARSPNK